MHHTRANVYDDACVCVGAPSYAHAQYSHTHIYFYLHTLTLTHYTTVLANLIQTPIDPRGLPPYFTQHIKVTDPARPGRVYFKDHSTRKTEWNDPRAKNTAQQRLEHRIRERKTWDEEQWARVAREKRKSNQATPFEEEQEMLIAIYQTQVDDIKESRKRWFRRQEEEWRIQAGAVQTKFSNETMVYTNKKNALLATLRGEMQEWHRKEMEAMERRRADVRMSQEVRINALDSELMAEMGHVMARKQKELDQFTSKKDAQLSERLSAQLVQENKLKVGLDAQLLALERRFAIQIEAERKQNEVREQQADEAVFEEQRRYQALFSGGQGQQQQQQQQRHQQQQQQQQQRHQQQQQQQQQRFVVQQGLTQNIPRPPPAPMTTQRNYNPPRSALSPSQGPNPNSSSSSNPMFPQINRTGQR
jgi:hypothetical protein